MPCNVSERQPILDRLARNKSPAATMLTAAMVLPGKKSCTKITWKKISKKKTLTPNSTTVSTTPPEVVWKMGLLEVFLLSESLQASSWGYVKLRRKVNCPVRPRKFKYSISKGCDIVQFDLHPRKPRWQWKIPFSTGNISSNGLFSMIFHCHVSFRGVITIYPKRSPSYTARIHIK